ncbi:MAG: hypothetical protein ACW975_14655 [Candidatus Thorarchaeota archaeon]
MRCVAHTRKSVELRELEAPIAYAELKSVNELKKFMDKVRLVPGFLHADTCVAL